MVGTAFSGGCLDENLLPPFGGENLGYRKLALGERTGLIENEGVDLLELFEIASALNQNSFAGSTADSAEKAQRNAYYEGAGTAYYEEGKSAHYPFFPLSGENRRDYREKNRGYNDYRGIIAGKLRYEFLGLSLLARSRFDHIQNLSDRGVVVFLLGSYVNHAAYVYRAA